MTAGASHPPVLVVAAGRPGLGSSVVAALVAMAAMAEGERVAWLEAHALEGGPETLAARLANADDHDLAVVDAGARRDGVWAACALPGASTLLLVTSDERADLAASYAMAKSAAAHADAPAIAVVANRVDAAAGRWAGEAFAEACARFLGRPAAIAGSLPDDPTLAAALAAGMPIADAADGSPVRDAAREVARALLAHAPHRSGARRAAAPPALSPLLNVRRS